MWYAIPIGIGLICLLISIISFNEYKTYGNQYGSFGTGVGALIWASILILGPIIIGVLISSSRRRAEDANIKRLQEKEAELLAERKDKLKAAHPASPVVRMRATIQTNSYKNAEGSTAFGVDMLLELTETERGIIKQYELDDVVLEDVPRYTHEDIERAADNLNREIDSISETNTLHHIKKQVRDMVLEDMRKARRITKVGDLVVVPYHRECGSPHEATEFADKLKTKFLPRLRQLLDKHETHLGSETIEF